MISQDGPKFLNFVVVSTFIVFLPHRGTSQGGRCLRVVGPVGLLPSLSQIFEKGVHK